MRSSRISFDYRQSYSQPTTPTSPTRPSYFSKKKVDDPLKVSVADLSSALIREYLLSLGYRKTLESLAKEDSLVIFMK